MIDTDKGDYGRGGVEAIRRLLHKDACIGADLTMVKLLVFTIVLFFSITVLFSILANRCQCYLCNSINQTTRYSCTTCSSFDLFLFGSFDSCHSSSGQ